MSQNYTPPFMGLYGTDYYNAQTLSRGYTWGLNKLKNQRKLAGHLNQLDAGIEMSQARRLFCSRFRWGGEEIEPYPYGYIETLLYENGFCIAFRDPSTGELAILPASIVGVNKYWTPTEFIATPAGGDLGADATFRLSAEECVVIKDNSLWEPMKAQLERRSGVVADVGRAIQTYIQGMKMSNLLFADDKTKLSLETAMQQKLDNAPYVIVDRRIDVATDKLPENLLNGSFNAADLNGMMQAKKALKAEMSNSIGIDAVEQQKSQYVSESEQQGDAQAGSHFLQDAIENRQFAIREIERKLGAKLECECVKDILQEKAREMDDADAEQDAQEEVRGGSDDNGE